MQTPNPTGTGPKTEARQAVDALGEAARDVRAGVREAGTAARDRFADSTTDAGANMRASADHAHAAVNGLADATRQYVNLHPGIALGAAFLGGMFIASLLRR